MLRVHNVSNKNLDFQKKVLFLLYDAVYTKRVTSSGSKRIKTRLKTSVY